MAVLTVARELGAIVRGEELTLCNTLNLKCVSRSTLEKKFAQLGMDEKFLHKFDECKPGLLSSINNDTSCYWETLRTVIMQEMLQDNIAVIGRGGNFLLYPLVKCLRIKLVAPEDYRIQHVAAEYAISDADAKKLIRQSDCARKNFCEFYYGENWNDPHNYDLVINTAEISMETLAKIIPHLMPPPLTADDKEELQILIQEQFIKHALFCASELQIRFPEVEYSADGTVTLHGSVPSGAAKIRAEEIVMSIPGVTAVNNELAIVLNEIPSRIPPFMH